MIKQNGLDMMFAAMNNIQAVSQLAVTLRSETRLTVRSPSISTGNDLSDMTRIQQKRVILREKSDVEAEGTIKQSSHAWTTSSTLDRKLMSTLSLNCLLFNDDSTQAFTVEIPQTKNVSILKELIKEKKARLLAHLDASDLTLYKVSLSDAEIDSHLKEANAHSKWISAVTRIHLQPLEELEEVFPEPLQKKHIHIIFKHGPGTCPRYL